MICERYWENRRFTPEAFWQLHIAAKVQDSDGVVKMPSVEKWKDKATATALYNNVKESNTATVVKVERKEKIEQHGYCRESRTKGENRRNTASV